MPNEYLGTKKNARANDGIGSDGASGIPVAKDIFWPRDLLPADIKDVRVLTFGYYSFPGDSSQDNLYTLSNKLLVCLENERADAVRYSRSLHYDLNAY